MTSEPALSIVIAIVSDTTEAEADAGHLCGTLEALRGQIDPPPLETIVPYHARVRGIDEARRRFPEATFLPVDRLSMMGGGSREHHDEMRARGLAAARAPIVGLLEDHGRPDPHWSARAVEAHRQPYAAVGGAIENGIDRPLNWAVYFCDFGRYQNPVPGGPSGFVSDANATYKRSALDAIRPVWEARFQETAVNSALVGRGGILALSPGLVVAQHRQNLRLRSALRERFIWGRSYAASRAAPVPPRARMIYASLAPLVPIVLLLRMARHAIERRRCLGAFVRALPLTALLTMAWSAGEFVGYVTGRAAGAQRE